MCRRRAPEIKNWKTTELVAVAGQTPELAASAAASMGIEAVPTWQELVQRDDLDIIVVSTPPDVHAEQSIAAMRAGKHVLCEKPLAKTLDEAREMVAVAAETGVTLKCGFNHRHHPAVWKAHELLASGALGTPLFGRCRYGICGRPGYEKEWRADPVRAAGGQYIEQGSHAIDLFRWFMGEVEDVAAMTTLQYFTTQTLDEAGMSIFRMKSGATASLHTTLTQWRNVFSFEIFGTDGYIEVDGLGGSYGLEKLTFGKREFDGPFATEVTEFRGGDISWREEWREFIASLDEGRRPIGDGHDGLVAMEVAMAAYQSEKDRQFKSV